jgi:hypothetical protein
VSQAVPRDGHVTAKPTRHSAETTRTPPDEENAAMLTMPAPLMFFERRLLCSF